MISSKVGKVFFKAKIILWDTFYIAYAIEQNPLIPSDAIDHFNYCSS